MVTQTTAVAQIFAGLDSGRKAQRRDKAGMPLSAALRFHYRHMLVGLALAVLSYLVSLSLMAGWRPSSRIVIVGGIERVDGAHVREISVALAGDQEDHEPPLILEVARERAAAWAHTGR